MAAALPLKACLPYRALDGRLLTAAAHHSPAGVLDEFIGMVAQEIMGRIYTSKPALESELVCHALHARRMHRLMSFYVLLRSMLKDRPIQFISSEKFR